MLNFRYRNQTSAWPGFVDLFSNLVIILIFLLIMFVFLWTTTSVFNKSTGAKVVAELKQINAEQAATIQEMDAYKQEANRLLLLARDELLSLEQDNTELAAELNDIDVSIEDLISAYENKIGQLQAQVTQNNADLTNKALLAAEMQKQLAQLNAALSAAEEKSRAQEVEYVEMSNRLNKALADKVAELQDVAQYQSYFYKSIKNALGDDTTLQQSGDRFIVNSDILFPSGSYKLSAAGKKQLGLIADVIKDMESKIPTDIAWIIRVDGHTDNKQVIPGTCDYKDNTELSLLRATAVVDELARAGVSKRRLVPSGFGEMHPVALGNDRASLQQNRRIELQLTNQ
jgi:chemotaxis protein MotB